MPEKAEKKRPEADKPEICFKCKFCGETKPLSQLVVMRHYYPQMSACKDCARSTGTTPQSDAA